MGKYLLLIAGVIVVYWLVRNSLRRRARARQQDEKTIAQDMVRCVECGVHLPRSESLVVRERYFCCAEHQRRHDAGD